MKEVTKLKAVFQLVLQLPMLLGLRREHPSMSNPESLQVAWRIDSWMVTTER